MKYSPSRNTRALFFVCFVLLVLFLLFFFVGAYFFSYRGILQAAGLVPLCAFLFLCARFALCDYSYLVEKSSLIVVKRQGKKEEKLCDIELSEGIALISHAERKRRKIAHAFCYNYCKNFASKEKYYFYFAFRDKTALLIFEPSEAMANEIRRYL